MAPSLTSARSEATKASPIASTTTASSWAGRRTASGRFHAFVTTINGGAIELNSLDPRADGDFGAALGVNSVGEVAGYYTTAGAPHVGPQSRLFLS